MNRTLKKFTIGYLSLILTGCDIGYPIVNTLTESQVSPIPIVTPIPGPTSDPVTPEWKVIPESETDINTPVDCTGIFSWDYSYTYLSYDDITTGIDSGMLVNRFGILYISTAINRNMPPEINYGQLQFGAIWLPLGTCQ